jgi:hypothetical protein
MGNMSYCRFSNTLGDLGDCYENMDDTPEEDCEVCKADAKRKEPICNREHISRKEAEARAELIELCRQIVREYGE